MSKNKRILNLHEHEFAELANFQANITLFQANTNASLKNLETQVGQLPLNMQNQTRDSFPSDTKNNPKDYMTITLRSDKEFQCINEVEKTQTDAEVGSKDHNSSGREQEQSRNELSDKNKKLKKKVQFGKQTYVKMQKKKMRK